MVEKNGQSTLRVLVLPQARHRLGEWMKIGREGLKIDVKDRRKHEPSEQLRPFWHVGGGGETLTPWSCERYLVNAACHAFGQASNVMLFTTGDNPFCAFLTLP